MEANYFIELNNVDVTPFIKKKTHFNYVSWAHAWAELKKRHPNATSKVYKNEKGWNYFTDDRTCWVEVGVTVNGIEHVEYFPILDFRNKSIPLDKVTSFEVNTAIQRALTKAIARHGIGLYIYAGEDLPPDMELEKKPFNVSSQEWYTIQKMKRQKQHIEGKLTDIL